jgi:hypothetical protein
MISKILLVTAAAIAAVVAVLTVQSRGEIARYREMRKM